MPLVLALDQGTTSSRAIVFDEEGNKLSQAQIPMPQIFPRPGWVEHDPEVMWANQLAVANKAISDAGVDRAGHLGDRHRQPAGDGGGLGPQDGDADRQRNRVAGPAHRRRDRRDDPQRRRAVGAREDRTAGGSLLLGDEDRLAAGQRQRRPRESRAGRPRVRHGGQLVRVEAHWWGFACDRLHQRLPVSAARHRPRRVGQRPLRPVRGAHVAVAQSRALLRRDGRIAARAAGRAHPHRVGVRRPAGGTRGQRWVLGGRREGDLRHRHLRAHAYRPEAAALGAPRRDAGSSDRSLARVRAGGLDLHGRGRGAVDRRGAEARRLARDRRRRSPRAFQTATAWCSCPRSPAWAPRSGTRWRGARSSG